MGPAGVGGHDPPRKGDLMTMLVSHARFPPGCCDRDLKAGTGTETRRARRKHGAREVELAVNLKRFLVDV